MTDAEHTRMTERLWTPWRMGYIGGETKEPGCIFCNRLEKSSDIESLILHRLEHSFVIMNLYPYNTGHIMLVPNQHASDPAELDPAALSEMGMFLPTLTNAIRRALGCQGFNVGLNIGAIAGAGVEAHLHQHLVPRWQGDANFMPILASTMTIPELIPVTYAKLRAELTREMTGSNTVQYVLHDRNGDRVLLHDGEVPMASAGVDQPAIQAVIAHVPPNVRDVALTGWAGPDSAASISQDDIVLSMTATLPDDLPAPWRVVSASDESIIPHAHTVIQRAISQRAPAR